MKNRKTKMSQKERILRYLRSGHKINTLVAINRFGITRLSAVIHNLKGDNMRIHSRFIPVRNRFGARMLVKQYMLA